MGRGGNSGGKEKEKRGRRVQQKLMLNDTRSHGERI